MDLSSKVVNLNHELVSWGNNFKSSEFFGEFGKSYWVIREWIEKKETGVLARFVSLKDRPSFLLGP